MTVAGIFAGLVRVFGACHAAVEHRRVDGARRNRVDPDIVRRQLKPRRLHQADDGALGGNVGRVKAPPAEGQLRGDHDDRTAAARPHRRQRADQPTPARLHVYRKDLIPLVGIDGVDGHTGAADPGDGAETVYLPRLGHRARDGRFRRDVAHNRLDPGGHIVAVQIDPDYPSTFR